MSVRNYGNRRSPEEVAKSMAAAKKVMDARRKKEAKKNIQYAKNALLFVGILQIVIGLYEGYGPQHVMLALYIDAGIGLVFMGLWWYAKEHTAQALLIALIIYVAIILLVAAVDISTLFQGILIKLIVITTLSAGLQSARKMRKKIKNNEELLDHPDYPDELDDL
jgi:hypothetical protein